MMKRSHLIGVLCAAIVSSVTLYSHARATRYLDVPIDHWAFSFIETLAASGITTGCGPNIYCPEASVTRAQMAVFLERGMRGSNYNPGPGVGNVFLDVPAGYWAGGWIELLSSDGITTGCGINIYCPEAAVTREQMAVFLLRAKYGQGYAPPTPTGVFNDVVLSHWAAPWIEQLAAEGITTGCGNNNYCPKDSVTRAQMAVFLVRTFGLVHSVGDTTITGMVINQTSQLPIEGARVKIEHTIDGNNAVVDVLTDASGQYSLNINSDRLPDPYLLVASASAYVPDVVDIPNDGQNRTVDFELRIINDSIVVIEIDPSLHHLGDNYFGGTINSQFQRTAEGTFYTKQFMLDSTQASSGSAIISLVAKGLQDSNPLIINGNTITYLDDSPSDGSFAKVTVNVPANILRSGSNTVRIESDVYFGDYDDFEFANIILEL